MMKTITPLAQILHIAQFSFQKKKHEPFKASIHKKKILIISIVCNSSKKGQIQTKDSAKVRDTTPADKAVPLFK